MNIKMIINHSSARFSLGRLVATPGALRFLEQSGLSSCQLLARHQTGDWGEIDAEDREANEQALIHGWRLVSVYSIDNGKIWIITEADRSTTTILLPEEY